MIRKVPAAPLHFGLAGLLALAAALPPGQVRLLLLGTLSGAPVLLALRPRWGTDLLLAPTLASLFLWAPLALVLWKVHLFALGPWLLAVMALGLGFRARRARSEMELSLSWADGAGLLALILVSIPIVAVFTHNGMEGGRYLARSWFGRDGAYLFALAQEAVERGAWPAENPLAAGLANYYPAMVHVGLGALSIEGGAPAAVDLIWLSPFYLACAPALWVYAAARSGTGWRAALAALLGGAGPFLLRPDLFIFPQAQPYAFGGLALLLWLGLDLSTALAQVAALVVAAEVILAHSVSGTVAVVLVGGQALQWLVDRSTRRLGAAAVAATLGLGLLFLRLSALPHPGARGPLSAQAFSGIEAFVAPWEWPLAAVATVLLMNLRRPAQIASTVGIVGLGLAYYAFGGTQLDPSDRWFVLFNAERFFHLALLVALPLVASRPNWVVLVAVGVVTASAILRPTGLALGSRNLLVEAPQVAEATDLTLFERIRRETPPEARLMTNWGGFLVPALTGRAQQPVEGRETTGAQGTVTPQDFAARFGDAQQFFRRPTQDWPAALD